MRTFVAIDLEPELKRVLEDLIRKLKRTGADVRWSGAEGMHLTLKFLGEVEPAAVPLVEQTVGAAASKHSRFPLTLRGSGTFPPGRSPRVLWVGIAEVSPLIDLQKAVEAGLDGVGYPPETRPFHPHLTLARVRGGARIQEAVTELETYRETVFGEMTVRKITLFQSLLKPLGAEYKVVREFELG